MSAAQDKVSAATNKAPTADMVVVTFTPDWVHGLAKMPVGPISFRVLLGKDDTLAEETDFLFEFNLQASVKIAEELKEKREAISTSIELWKQGQFSEKYGACINQSPNRTHINNEKLKILSVKLQVLPTETRKNTLIWKSFSTNKSNPNANCFEVIKGIQYQLVIHFDKDSSIPQLIAAKHTIKIFLFDKKVNNLKQRFIKIKDFNNYKIDWARSNTFLLKPSNDIYDWNKLLFDLKQTIDITKVELPILEPNNYTPEFPIPVHGIQERFIEPSQSLLCKALLCLEAYTRPLAYKSETNVASKDPLHETIVAQAKHYLNFLSVFTKLPATQKMKRYLKDPVSFMKIEQDIQDGKRTTLEVGLSLRPENSDDTLDKLQVEGHKILMIILQQLDWILKLPNKPTNFESELETNMEYFGRIFLVIVANKKFQALIPSYFKRVEEAYTGLFLSYTTNFNKYRGLVTSRKSATILKIVTEWPHAPTLLEKIEATGCFSFKPAMIDFDRCNHLATDLQVCGWLPWRDPKKMDQILRNVAKRHGLTIFSVNNVNNATSNSISSTSNISAGSSKGSAENAATAATNTAVPPITATGQNSSSQQDQQTTSPTILLSTAAIATTTGTVTPAATITTKTTTTAATPAPSSNPNPTSDGFWPPPFPT